MRSLNQRLVDIRRENLRLYLSIKPEIGETLDEEDIKKRKGLEKELRDLGYIK